jgi:hypothetical protein
MPDNYKKMRSNDNFRGEPSENKPATITRSNQAGTRTIATDILNKATEKLVTGIDKFFDKGTAYAEEGKAKLKQAKTDAGKVKDNFKRVDPKDLLK